MRDDSHALQTAPTRQAIERLQSALFDLPADQLIDIDAATSHTFGPGFYARTLTLPAGATAVGKIHATEHLLMVTRGEVVLITDGARLHVTAPFQAVCAPGAKKAVHCLTDAVITNFHATDLTDLAALEAALIVPESLPAPAVREVLQ